jgi:hypothetical protein
MESRMRSEVLMFSLCACLSRIYNLHVQVSIEICQLESYVCYCVDRSELSIGATCCRGPTPFKQERIAKYTFEHV